MMDGDGRRISRDAQETDERSAALRALSLAARPLRSFGAEGRAVAGYSILGALPFSMLLFMPMFVGGFVKDLGLSDASAGYIASINIAGSGVAALLAFLWVQRLSIRRVVFGALIVFILSNVFSGFISSFAPLAGLRFIEGFAAGTMTSGILVAIAKTQAPDRNYGIWLAAQLLYGTIGYLAIPALFTKFGVASGFFIIAGLGLCVAPLVRLLPIKGAAEEAIAAPSAPLGRRRPEWGVAALFVFYVGLNVVWAYLERIGDHAGLSIEAIGAALSVANFAGLAGAVSVAIIGDRFGRLWPIAIALTMTAVSVLGLLGAPGAGVYTLAVSIYLFGWIFLVPLMLGAIAELDKSGKHIAFANAGLGVGLALGPVIGAQLTGNQLVGGEESYSVMIWTSAALMMLSLFVILPILTPKAEKRDEA